MKKTSWYEYLTPLFLAIFPVLSLALANIEFVLFSAILRSLLISVAVTALFYLLFRLILKDWVKAGILAGGLTFLLLTYGNAYVFFQERLGVSHALLLGIYAVILIAAAVFLRFGLKDPRDLNRAVFTGSLVIVIYLLGSMGYYQFRVSRAEARAENTAAPFTSELTEAELAALPDVYLILLDGHTRSDVLRDVYGYDNSGFIGQLEQMGFLVADCAQSNYPSTTFSTGAMFEMDYLHNIYRNYDNLVLPPLNNTAVFQTLDDYQYNLVTFSNFVFDHFNIQDDHRLAKEDRLFGSINEYEKMLVDTSILRTVTEMEGVFPVSWVALFQEDHLYTHYQDTAYALNTLPTLPEMNGRKFVYAHLLTTHDPFVFLADGSFNPADKITAENYTYTVEYTDEVLPGIIEEIIASSEVPPVIIVMGDHGAPIKATPIEERLSILFAIYLQGEKPVGFYNHITPVNAFRMVFNYLFDADLDLIEDTSYDIWNKANLGDIDEPVSVQCSP